MELINARRSRHVIVGSFLESVVSIRAVTAPTQCLQYWSILVTGSTCDDVRELPDSTV